jgi:hypothetical protein
MGRLLFKRNLRVEAPLFAKQREPALNEVKGDGGEFMMIEIYRHGINY